MARPGRAARPPSAGRASIGLHLLGLAGLAVAVTLVVLHGAGDVLAAVAVAGWGMALVAALQILPMGADTAAWQRLVSGGTRFRRLFWVRWIGESVNNLLPTATVGAEVLRAWLAHRHARMPGAVAGGSVVVDLTMAVVTQVLFTLMGLGILLSLGTGDGLVVAVVIACAGLVVLVGAFIAMQRAGMFGYAGRFVASLAHRLGWAGIGEDARALDAEIRRIYARRRLLLASMSWRLLSWMSSTFEVWLALWFLGHPVSFSEALMIESLIQALRSAAFLVPGALGVQEAGLLVLGSVIGLPPEVALALSLIKRVRELAWGIPGLLAWQASSLRRLWAPAASRA